MSKTVVLTYPDETPDERIKADLAGIVQGFGPKALGPIFGIDADASPGLAQFARQQGSTVVPPESGGGGGDFCFEQDEQVFVVGAELGSSGQGTVTSGLSPPLPDPITYIALDPASGIANFGQSAPLYKTGQAAGGSQIETLAFAARGGSMVAVEIAPTKAIVSDGQTSGSFTFSVADSEVTAVSGGADVELDVGDPWTVRNNSQVEGSAVTVTVAEDDGEFYGRFPADAAPIKHGDVLFGDPGITAGVSAGVLTELVGVVLMGKDGDGPLFIENTNGSKNIQGTVVAETIGGGGGAGIRIDTPYNVVQNGDGMPITKTDSTTLLGQTALAGIGADGKAVARFVGALAVLADQDAVVVGGSTYTFTIADNVITDIDIT